MTDLHDLHLGDIVRATSKFGLTNHTLVLLSELKHISTDDGEDWFLTWETMGAENPNFKLRLSTQFFNIEKLT